MPKKDTAAQKEHIKDTYGVGIRLSLTCG